MKKLLIFMGIFLSLISVQAIAAPPRQINFQGRLTTVYGTPETGIKLITFRLHTDPVVDSMVWHQNDLACSCDVIGAFSAILGGDSAPLDVDFSQPLWMEVVYNGTQFVPRQQLTCVPYAFFAITAESVVGGTGGITQEVDTLDTVLSRGNISTFDAQVGNLTVEGNLKVTGTIEGGGPVQIAGGLSMADGVLRVGDTASIDASGYIYGDGSRLTGLPGCGMSTADADTRYLRNTTEAQDGNLLITGIGYVTGGLTAGYIMSYGALSTNRGAANGESSVALGYFTKANGDYSTAMGYLSTTAAGGNGATAMGYTAFAGDSATSLGFYTRASGQYSTAMGRSTTASGWNSTSFGRDALAEANYSTAMGYATRAVYQEGSTAMGMYTIASGNYSTAMGLYASAEGDASTAMGDHTIARPYASLVIGQYNVATGQKSYWNDADPVFVIGNGADDSHHSNAMTVLQNGNVGIATSNPGTTRLYVEGSVEITGDLNVVGTVSKGGGSFLIDHPLDPKNKVLRHSFVESPEMRNIYEGAAVLDNSGAAVVELPKYFEALNKDYRYQLTCVGGFAPVYIKEEIKGNKFVIAGGKPGLKVNWMVTGTRHDAFALKHPIIVEEEKGVGTSKDIVKGQYLHPDSF